MSFSAACNESTLSLYLPASPCISLHLAASPCISLYLRMQAEGVAARQAISAEGAARLSAAEAEAGEHARAAVEAGAALRQARGALAP